MRRELERMSEEYGEVTARYYDAAYAGLRTGSGDADFYLELARESGGPVLELGCGTGRVLLPIARAGIPCTGLDLSEPMLEALREREPPASLRLVRAPMQDFDLGAERFRLIFSAFRVFQHLYTVQDQLSFLACVRRHLARGGRFAFDVFAPGLARTALAEEPEREDARFELDGDLVVRHTGVTREHEKQLMRLQMRYERWRGGEVVDNQSVAFLMRYFFRFELEHLLARAGFESFELYGDFERGPYDGTGDMIFVASAG